MGDQLELVLGSTAANEEQIEAIRGLFPGAFVEGVLDPQRLLAQLGLGAEGGERQLQGRSGRACEMHREEVRGEERRSQLLAQKANQDRDIAQMERFVERFRAKATKARQAQSRMKALDRIDRIEIEDDRIRQTRGNCGDTALAIR